MSDGSDQRCSYANCKNWDYAGSSKEPPNLCNDILITQAMITVADTLASKLCTKVTDQTHKKIISNLYYTREVTDHANNVVAEVYPKFSKSLRFGLYENGTNSADLTHYATIHYIGKGIFKYMNRAFDEWFMMIENEDKTILRFCEDYTSFGETPTDVKRIVLTYDDSDDITKLEFKKNDDSVASSFNKVDTFSQPIVNVQILPKEEYCTECWDKDDVANHGTWDARFIYTDQEVYGIVVDTPF
jgi:hypothetical protein